MRSLTCFASMLAIALAAQPCAAADDVRDPYGLAQRTGAFAGATLKLGLNESRRGSEVQLGLGISQTLQRPGSAALVQIPGLELSFASGKPSFLIAGQSAASIQRRHGLAGAPVLLAVGGLAGAALLVGAASGSDRDPELDRVQCLLPEKELCR